jgi:DNA-binding GntR family transcriptional regulator
LSATASSRQRPPETAPAAREPALAEIVRGLEFDILFGRLKPRERLVEDAVMARFGAKRHAVRQAFAELERMGIVVRAPNRGASVRDFTAREVDEIYEMRELLQRRAAQLIPLPVDRGLLAELEAIQARHDRAVEAGNLREIDQINDVFHRTLFAASGNAHLADAIGYYAQLTRAVRLMHIVEPASLARVREEHWAMIEALRAGDRSALVHLVVAHIQPSRTAYLAVRKALDLA